MRQAPRQKLRLIEASMPPTEPVQRHGNDGVERLLGRDRLRQQVTQRLRHRLHTSVFIKMNPLAEYSFVGTEAVGRIETAKAVAAERAEPLVIQREGIPKRGSTT